jgi:DNA invertase Pin-like site-specific DNA recombinase
MNLSCVIYIRVSDQQQTRGSSLADQECACREFAKRSGLKVVRVYRDEGRSAFKDDVRHRPQFAAMLQAAAARAFKAVIVYKLDRFARRARIFHTSRWQLEQVGVQLLSATEPNESTAAGRLSSGMLAEFAEFYSAQLSERIKGAALSKAARGEWVGSAPFGYVLDPRTHQLAVGPHWIWVVCIFVAYDLGATTPAIAAALNVAGVSLGRGKPWTKDSVLMVLRNHAYIGRAGGRALEAYDAAHEHLVSLELWQRVQDTLGTRRKRPLGPRRASTLPPLSYEPRCALCGGRMHRHRQPKAMYFRCRRARSRACEAKGVKLDLVEHQVELIRRSGAPVAIVWLRAPRGIERFE